MMNVRSLARSYTIDTSFRLYRDETVITSEREKKILKLKFKLRQKSYASIETRGNNSQENSDIGGERKLLSVVSEGKIKRLRHEALCFKYSRVIQ